MADAILGVALAVVSAMVVITGWLAFHLLQSTGRILIRLEEVEERVSKRSNDDPVPSGFPVGTIASDFELPNLSGSHMTLSQWQGHRLLLIFFSPDCPYSRELLPALASLSTDSADSRPIPVIVTTGDAQENGLLVDRYALRGPVLLQEDWEVGARYQVTGTPMGYLIDERGATVSDLVVGPDALLTLLASSAIITNGVVPLRFGAGRTTPRPSRFWPDRPYAEPWPTDTGLAAGTAAPDFHLPRVDGSDEISIRDYRGRRVLLVFSDPACQPCNELAPELEQRHRAASDPQVLMVSRRDLEGNRAMIAHHNLTFPVVLQRHWEVSRDYGLLATPVAYLIDEAGVVAANAAIGSEAILALQASLAGRRPGPKEVVPNKN